MKPILSICVVTMNRSQKVKEALLSCMKCELPEDVEFIIVDNGSTDDTADAIKQLFNETKYYYKYIRMKENIGAGAGRNIYFQNASGKYIYGMDDDAYIDVNNKYFFIEGIALMEKYPAIAALATQIYDKAWERNRQNISGREVYPGVYRTKMFNGGSHFLRKEVYDCKPYFPNKYGYEELPPSLLAYEKGLITAVAPKLTVIHNPAVNKWNQNYAENKELLIRECAIPFAIRKMMYPVVAWPLLKMAYNKRCKKYLINIPNGRILADKMVNDTLLHYSIDWKISLRTLLYLVGLFKFQVF